jgi:hypothetical protein
MYRKLQRDLPTTGTRKHEHRHELIKLREGEYLRTPDDPRAEVPSARRRNRSQCEHIRPKFVSTPSLLQDAILTTFPFAKKFKRPH